MKKTNGYLFLFAALCLYLFFPSGGRAQLVLGQYEDEAPMQTWNSLGILTGASLGLGGTCFTLAENSAVALVNPALLAKLPTISVTLSGSYSTTSFFKYSLVNTGVLSSSQNQTLGLYAGEFAGVSFRYQGWAFSFGIAALEYYNRPEVDWEYTFGNQTYYALRFSQDGQLLNYNFSLARQITNWLAVGLGLNLVRGKHEKHLEETWVQADRSILDDKTQNLRGYFFNAGLLFNLSDSLAVAAIFRTPYTRKADSESLYRFLNPGSGVDIQIDASEMSSFKQPLVLGMGASYVITTGLLVTANAAYYNWASYAVDYFGEPLTRNFKSKVKINAGVEYSSGHYLLGRMVNVPFRAGLIYDPQPMANPDSYYFGYSLGIGVSSRNFVLDLGYLSAKEYGSGQDLNINRIVLTLSFLII